MPPSSLNGYYQQYKADTDIVAQWLELTAKEHGYQGSNSPSASNPAATRGRRKGKAGKQAQATTSGQASSSAAMPGVGPKTTHIIKTRDFEPMATHIAGCSEGVSIPRYFARALDRVISVRKTFSARLASNGVQISAESDKSHSFFVEVLEKVREVLQPLLATVQVSSVSVAAEAATPETASEQPGELFHNLFGVLEVYQTSSQFEKQPDAVPPPPPAPAPAQTAYVAEQGTSAMDLVFAMTALLGDLSQLRAKIMELWTYGDAKMLDLASLSVATNTAFELARSLEEDLEPLFKEVGGTHAFVTTYFRSLCKALGLDPMAKEQPGDPYNLAAYDVADHCFINTLTLVSSFTATALPSSAAFQDYNGKFGWYDEALGGDGVSNRQRWTQDMTAVLELMPDLSFLVSNLDCLSVVDEITRGVAYQIQERRKTTPLWLAFAVQVYLDILQTNDQVGDALEIMQEESLKIKHSLLDVPEADRRAVLRAAGLWDEDPIWAARKLAVAAGFLPKVRSPPFKFLRRNPMYCGLLVHHMRTTLHMEGLRYAAAPGALVGVVQLYHVLRREGLVPEDCVWEGLKTLWKLQGNASFFVGNLPTTKEAYFSNYCLSIGTSVTHWAAAQSRRKTKNKVNVHSANRRNLKPLAHFSLAVSHRLERPGARAPWSVTAVQEVLSLSLTQRFTDSRSHIEPEAKAEVEEAKLRWAALLPAGLVHQVAGMVESEWYFLTCFNFFTMHNEAWLFLERLQAGLVAGPGLSPAPPPLPRGYSNAQMLPFVSGVCFAAAAGQSLDRAQTVPTSDAPLRTAAAVLQKFVREGHGRRMDDDSGREVEPDEVQALRQGLDLWHLDDKGRVGDERYNARRPAGGNEDIEMLMSLLKVNMDMNGGGSGGGDGDLARLLQMLSSM
ncbi:hypothetical protein BBO_00873 [Beauveria brongniartii RCEF 3172]|uniref:DUF6604 domain-containing protein n=1 Tax=Beauveria brongniartii RCEF 3172 TaxID=1081107 RepID=A0A167JXB8_9HYPO|nr:hypothetical protein BBO_00873 [Beauveria brongniartii RCEF 3172]